MAYAVTVAMLACNDTSATFDASPGDGAAPDVYDPSVCHVSIASYCDAHVCPADQDAALAALCANGLTVVSCGGVVEGNMIDIGSGYAFVDGSLENIFTFKNGTTTCVAGEVGAIVTAGVGCPITSDACLTDAGDASDQ